MWFDGAGKLRIIAVDMALGKPSHEDKQTHQGR